VAQEVGVGQGEGRALGHQALMAGDRGREHAGGRRQVADLGDPAREVGERDEQRRDAEGHPAQQGGQVVDALLPLAAGGDRTAGGARARVAEDPGEVAAHEREPVHAVGGRVEGTADRAAGLLDALADLRELVDGVVDLGTEDGEDGQQEQDDDVGGDRRPQGARGGGVEAHGARVPARARVGPRRPVRLLSRR
jgi:hypothetical protein